MRVPVVDVPKVVAIYGGPIGWERACADVGLTLPSSTIRKWLSRRRLPMDGWLLMSRTHEIKKGAPLHLNDFLTNR